MADDTVERLKQKIVDDGYDGDCTKAQLIAHIDALIAAVRAEQSPPTVDKKPTTHMKKGDGGTVCGVERKRGNSFYEWAYVNCPDCLAHRGTAS